MATGTMTEEQFKALAERFLELSDHIGDGWELITSEGGNTVYLKKRLKQTLNCIGSSTTADRELIADDPSLALPPENSNASNSDVYQFEYHVVYSVSYQVPVLYFNAFKSDGTMLRLEDAWDGFRDLALESREQLRQTLTQMEHPVVFKPFLALHPCRTAQVLGDIATGCGNAIVAFLSSYGPFVNLHLDIRYGGLVK
ncbi:ubiquitin-like-conjugating enzyme ATG10 [Armigeres subalbatus]|uniref:ubiquitin-like-conjugating enzyme ATG10 n=1 Tax=Armigeres subalbatus TaxID=124917 RepID=UPI002ED05F77